MLERIGVASIPVERYTSLVAESQLMDLRLAVGDLGGARVLHVVASRCGAQTRRTAGRVGLAQALGVAADLAVIALDPAGARAASALASRLAGLEAGFGRDERATWLENLSREAARFDDEYDVVFLHGVEAAGILSLRGPTRARWLWVPETDLSRAQGDAWSFLNPLLRDFDALVFASESFAPAELGQERAVVACPGVDPLSLRNLDLGPAARDAVLGMGIDPSRPLVVQRALPTGEVHETIAAWRTARRRRRDLQLAVVVVAEPYDECLAALRAACADDADVHVLCSADGCGDLELNALQRVASLVVHADDDDALGLTAADAMWKGTPVLVAERPGLALLTADGAGRTWAGTDGLASGISALVEDHAAASALGRAGHDRIGAYFLSPRLLLDELTLVRAALGHPRPGRPGGRFDPVCGMPVKDGTAVAEAPFDGKVYGFCSQRCRQRFELEPSRWLRRPLAMGA